jgi:hypothetical protein
MKITEAVRKYAAEQGIAETEALESGMQQKKREFAEEGSGLYARTLSRLGNARAGPAGCGAFAMMNFSRSQQIPTK